MAWVGQLCWQAVATAPSASALPSRLAWARASWMRWTQSEHFSITPRLRTTTSGLSTSRSTGSSCRYSNQLKRLTFGGQLLAQHRAHRLAGSVGAVLAHDRLVQHLRVLRVACVVPVDPDPAHLPVAQHLVSPHHRD